MSPREPKIRPIEDEAMRATLLARVAQRVSLERDMRLTITRHADLVAVPVRGSCHFNLADVERIGRAFGALGFREAYAVALEHWLRIEPAYLLEPSPEGVRAFDKTCSHFNYALCSQDFGSLVVCSTDDFFIVMGQEPFVSGALGSSVDEAFHAFAEYAAEPTMPPSFASFLAGIHRALGAVLPGLEAGRQVAIPRE